jgi:hypothetical protein
MQQHTNFKDYESDDDVISIKGIIKLSSINLPTSIPTTNEFPSTPLKNNEKESPTSNGTVPVNLLDFYDGGQLFHYREYIYMPAAAAAAATGTATAASEE